MTFLIEGTDPRAVIDDVLTDLISGKHPILLGLLCEAKLAGFDDPFDLADVLDEEDLEALGERTTLQRLFVSTFAG